MLRFKKVKDIDVDSEFEKVRFPFGRGMLIDYDDDMKYNIDVEQSIVQKYQMILSMDECKLYAEMALNALNKSIPCIYIVAFRNDDSKWMLKIGETNNLKVHKGRPIKDRLHPFFINT